MSANTKQFDLIDFYEVLGIEDRNMPTNEIRKKYVKLAVKYHPDKSKNADPQIFALIQRAWECLGNDNTRQEYDYYLSNAKKSKQGDYFSLKREFDNFQELSKNDMENEQAISRAKIEFEKNFNDMDKKHKFDRTKFREIAPTEKECKSRYNDLMLEREQQEIEFSQSRLFPEGTKIDMKLFNRAFDLKHQKKQKSKTDLIKHEDGPSAWNSVSGTSNFTFLDSFDKTYDDNDADVVGENYGSIKNDEDFDLDDLEYEELKNMKGGDYVDNHNYKDKNYQSELEKRLSERKMETEQLSNIKYADFKNEDKSFLFTHDVGYVGGLDWENMDGENDDLQKACDRLLRLENRN